MRLTSKDFNRNALVQTEVVAEPESLPLATVLPLDTFKLERVLSEPTQEQIPVFDYQKKINVLDWSDCEMFKQIYPQARTSLAK